MATYGFDGIARLPGLLGGATTPTTTQAPVNRITGLDTTPALPAAPSNSEKWLEAIKGIGQSSIGQLPSRPGLARPSALPRFGAQSFSRVPAMPGMPQASPAYGTTRRGLETEAATPPPAPPSAIPVSATAPAKYYKPRSEMTVSERREHDFGAATPESMAAAAATDKNKDALLKSLDAGDAKRYNDLMKFDLELDARVRAQGPDWARGYAQWVAAGRPGGPGNAKYSSLVNDIEGDLGIDSTDHGRHTARGFLEERMPAYFPGGGPFSADVIAKKDAEEAEYRSGLDEQKRKQAEADAQLALNNKQVQEYLASMTARLDENDPEVSRIMGLVGGAAGHEASDAARMRGIEGGMSLRGIADATGRATQAGLNDLSRFRNGQALQALGMAGQQAGGMQNNAMQLRTLGQQERGFLSRMNEDRYQYQTSRRDQQTMGEYAANRDRAGGVGGMIGGGLGAAVGAVGGFFGGGGPAGAVAGAQAGWNIGSGVGGNIGAGGVRYPGSGYGYKGGY